MTDSDIRDALTAYTGDEPPLTFAYEQVLTAGRRARRRRRIATSLVFVAVAGVAVAAWPHVRDEPAPVVVAGPSWESLDPAPFCAAAAVPPSGPEVQQTTTVVKENGYRIRIPAEPVGHAAARLSCYLASAVPALLPGSSYHLVPGLPEDTVPLQAYAADVPDPAQPHFSAEALVSDGEGVGEIAFGAWPAAESIQDAIASCTGCDVRPGQDGATVLIDEVTADSGVRLVNVWVHKGDTVAFATAANTLPDEAADWDKQPVGRPDPPLTVDQLVELADAAELTLFP